MNVFGSDMIDIFVGAAELRIEDAIYRAEPSYRRLFFGYKHNPDGPGISIDRR
jgi:hypothetical protein